MNHCCKSKAKTDYLFWSMFSISLVAYLLYAFSPPVLGAFPALREFTHSVYEILNKMWWGLVVGLIFVAIIGVVPRDVVIKTLGKEKGIKSILKATIAGVLLDLCSHGILLVAMKLYERGIRLSQVIAFLIASPWNSLSLTVILIAMIGWKWTLLYIFLSVVVAVLSGLAAEFAVHKKFLSENPHHIQISKDFSIKESLKKEFEGKKLGEVFSPSLFLNSFRESEMILRWLFLGVVAAGLIRTFVPTDIFAQYFGPSFIGLVLTLVAATIIEVCSEGSVPIAYDLFTRAAAPGNSFLFLMAGASTDYTEIMSLKETTGSWKIAFFLPLVTVPQILILGYILNNF